MQRPQQFLVTSSHSHRSNTTSNTYNIYSIFLKVHTEVILVIL